MTWQRCFEVKWDILSRLTNLYCLKNWDITALNHSGMRFASLKRPRPAAWSISSSPRQTVTGGRAIGGGWGESRRTASSNAPARSGRENGRSRRTGSVKVGRPPNGGRDGGGVSAHCPPAAGWEWRWSRWSWLGEDGRTDTSWGRRVCCRCWFRVAVDAADVKVCRRCGCVVSAEVSCSRPSARAINNHLAFRWPSVLFLAKPRQCVSSVA